LKFRLQLNCSRSTSAYVEANCLLVCPQRPVFGPDSYVFWSTPWVSKLFTAKGHPHPLLSAGSRDARGNIRVSGIPNRLNYCVIFIACIQFTNASAGRIIQPGGPRVGDPWSSLYLPILSMLISILILLSHLHQFPRVRGCQHFKLFCLMPFRQLKEGRKCI
jgi:hypothetical protein